MLPPDPHLRPSAPRDRRTCPPPPSPLPPGPQILGMSPAEVFRTHERVAQLAESLTRRAQGLLESKWLPRPGGARAGSAVKGVT